jgi:hypothetical protein
MLHVSAPTLALPLLLFPVKLANPLPVFLLCQLSVLCSAIDRQLGVL